MLMWKMIGVGTCMIRSRALIILAIKIPSNIYAKPAPKLFMNWNTWDYHFHVWTMAEFINAPLAANLKILAANRQRVLVPRPIEQGMPYYIRFISKILR